MKKINIKYTTLALLLVASLAACRKDPVVGGTATQAVAGTWWVHFAAGDGDYSNPKQYFNLATYNTAANIPTEMWFDDLNNAKSFWDVKGKVAVSGLTFSGTNVSNVDYASKFTITNGKIIPNAATAPGSKDKVDSIYFNITFSDDDPSITTPHVVAGYKRTGFASDDHY